MSEKKLNSQRDYLLTKLEPQLDRLLLKQIAYENEDFLTQLRKAIDFLKNMQRIHVMDEDQDLSALTGAFITKLEELFWEVEPNVGKNFYTIGDWQKDFPGHTRKRKNSTVSDNEPEPTEQETVGPAEGFDHAWG